MAAQKELNDLAERKRLLILQSDLHRAVLDAEWIKARVRIERLQQLGRGLRESPWMIAGGAAAGLFAIRNWRKAFKWAPAVFGAWRWLRRLRG
jgi:hypothetical protein